MGAVVSCIKSVLRAIGNCITAVINGIANILKAIINGIASVFTIIISCLTCGRTGRSRGTRRMGGGMGRHTRTTRAI